MNATMLSSARNVDEVYLYAMHTGFALDDVEAPTKVVGAWASFNLTILDDAKSDLDQDTTLQKDVEKVRIKNKVSNHNPFDHIVRPVQTIGKN